MLGLTGLPSVSTSVSSKSGDAGGSYDSGLQYNSNVQIGGSGRATFDTSATQEKKGGSTTGNGGVDSPASNMAVYIAIGVVGLIAVAAILANAGGTK